MSPMYVSFSATDAASLEYEDTSATPSLFGQ
jgi:hypothetical protein